MPPDDRWTVVQEIFAAALQHPRDELPRFLEEACAGDDGLRREVESLLAHDRDAGAFLQTPALGAATRKVQNLDRSFVGQILGHYRVIRQIGSGGMGEVYLAQDARLGRQVAVKVLARELSDDEQWKARFVQEAKAASALNHPNIATVYDFGKRITAAITSHASGATFCQPSLVSGWTLDRL
jgi:serine/threonine protein kinase